MKLNRPSPRAHRPALAAAFTIIEMMITVALLGFMVLGLTAMFVTTQRAFRAGMTQTDVLEAGRAATELMTRELEQTRPSRITGATNFFSRYEADSTSKLTGTFPSRSNVLSCFFMLTENNKKWTGIGYIVAVPTNAINADYNLGRSVGTLYRFQYPPAGVNTNPSPAYITARFQATAIRAINNITNGSVNGFVPDFIDPGARNISSNLSRVCDGVVHLRTLAYNTNGVLLTPTNSFLVKNTRISDNLSRVNVAAGGFPSANYPVSGMIEYTFTNNAVPAYLDLEFGVLEAQVMDRYRSIPNDAAKAQYLTRQAAGIHVFRRRVNVQNVDLEAYK